MRKKRIPECAVFKEESRREFLSGFHKRKVARKKYFEEKLEQDLKEAKKRIKAKARETFKSIIRSYEQTYHVPAIFEKEYELPDHTVKVRELLAEDIAKENNWIGQNRPMNVVDNDVDQQLTSLKAVKKIVCKQSTTIMKTEKAFMKKNRMEKQKNRKKAAMGKRILQKEQQRKKRKRRK